MTFETLSGHELLRLVIAIVASYLLALPVGWERKRQRMRTSGCACFLSSR